MYFEIKDMKSDVFDIPAGVTYLSVDNCPLFGIN
jgi:hypothetical protein